MSKPSFRIYIAGSSSRNRELVTTFREACSKLFSNNHQIDVIDIVKKPKEAEINKILATPTIVRVRPFPEKRIIGDFGEAGKASQAIKFLTDDLNIFSKNGED